MDKQEFASYAGSRSMILRAEGRLEEALAETDKALEARHALGPIYPGVKIALAEAVGAAFQLQDLGRVDELLEMIDALPAGDSTPFQRAQRDRFGASLPAGSCFRWAGRGPLRPKGRRARWPLSVSS